MALDLFKEFVRKNPKLIKFVKNGDMTWQKFYEMFDLYGENNDIWKEYISDDIKKDAAVAATTGFSVAEFFNWMKNVDLDSIQNSVNSLQRVIGVMEDFTKKDNKDTKTNDYKPRPIYKHFED